MECIHAIMLDHQENLVHKCLGVKDAAVYVMLNYEGHQFGSGVGFFVYHGLEYTRTGGKGNHFFNT